VRIAGRKFNHAFKAIKDHEQALLKPLISVLTLRASDVRMRILGLAEVDATIRAPTLIDVVVNSASGGKIR
jgi:hypothetical protein